MRVRWMRSTLGGTRARRSDASLCRAECSCTPAPVRRWVDCEKSSLKRSKLDCRWLMFLGGAGNSVPLLGFRVEKASRSDPGQSFVHAVHLQNPNCQPSPSHPAHPCKHPCPCPTCCRTTTDPWTRSLRAEGGWQAARLEELWASSSDQSHSGGDPLPVEEGLKELEV